MILAGRKLTDTGIVEIPMVRLFVPRLVQSRLNGVLARSHWPAIRRWTNAWHEAVKVAWMLDGRPRWLGTGRMTLTAYVGHLYDDDGLAAALKPARDEATRLIFDGETRSAVPAQDGPGSGHIYINHQVVVPRPKRGLLITVNAEERS